MAPGVRSKIRGMRDLLPLVVVTSTGTLTEELRGAVRTPVVCLRPQDVTADHARRASGAIVDLDLSAAFRDPSSRAGLLGLNALQILVLASPADVAWTKEWSGPGRRDVLVRPFDGGELARRIARLPARRGLVEDRPSPLAVAEVQAGVAQAVSAGTAVLASVFAEIGSGRAPRLAPFRDATHSVVSGLAQAARSAASLSVWLDTVKNHHSPTFGHSLTVTANAVLFGLDLGMRRSDLERLSIAGLLHDIGKAVVPLDILDKPARLDPTEAEQIKRHPWIGRDLLLRSPDPVAPEIIDVVLHHHEYLDGSGYPDGLRGSEISDLVRVVTIADIFTALVEDRAYKPGMAPCAALAVLDEMADAGKLDPALVRRFAGMVNASEAALAA